jgi:hypothetical protein
MTKHPNVPAGTYAPGAPIAPAPVQPMNVPPPKHPGGPAVRHAPSAPPSPAVRPARVPR